MVFTGEHYRLSPLPPRSQSARGPPSNHHVAVERPADEEETQRRRDGTDEAFSAWLRQKQREAADRRRRPTQKNEPASEVGLSFVAALMS